MNSDPRQVNHHKARPNFEGYLCQRLNRDLLGVQFIFRFNDRCVVAGKVKNHVSLNSLVEFAVNALKLRALDVGVRIATDRKGQVSTDADLPRAANSLVHRAPHPHIHALLRMDEYLFFVFLVFKP